MSRRIDIELTSARSDGSFTWRAAGAREPKGLLAGSILPPGAAVGDEFKVEVDQMIDGIEVLSVVKGREKASPDLLELLPSDKPFEAVIETRARRDRGGGGRDRRDDRGGRGRDGKRRDDRPPRGDRDRDGAGRGGRDRDGAGRGGRERDGAGRDDKARAGRTPDGGRPRRDRPHFDPPPEIPLRPKPKRLRPGKTHRNEVLAALPEDQRPIAEVALQGMAAVRTRLAEENQKLVEAGKPVMPEAGVTKMAEELLPKLRVADWLDRAEAAQRQMDHLDLRDLRSVVAAGADPIVARDESTRSIATELQAALVRKQEEELALWLEDVAAALGVGRVIRALRLSSQPPKAGFMFPPDLAHRLATAATESLQPDDSPDRWAAVMEAAAFSPVRSLVVPTTPPSEINDDLRKTALRLGPLLPQMAALLGVEVPPGTPKPKPLRPQYGKDRKDRGRDRKDGGKDRRDGQVGKDGSKPLRGAGARSGGSDGRARHDRSATSGGSHAPPSAGDAPADVADVDSALAPEPEAVDSAPAPEPEAADTAPAPEPEATEPAAATHTTPPDSAPTPEPESAEPAAATPAAPPEPEAASEDDGAGAEPNTGD